MSWISIESRIHKRDAATIMNDSIRFKSLETTTTLGFVSLVAGYYFQLNWILILSAFFLFCGLFWSSMANRIHHVWSKFSHRLGAIASSFFLSFVFFVFLTPIAWLYRLFHQDQLDLKPGKNSYFHDHETHFDKSYFERIW